MAKANQAIIDAIIKEIEQVKVLCRFIPGYEGHYKITSNGDVLSVKLASPRLLKKRKDCDGYLRVVLYVDNVPKGYMIHRLVAITFIDNPKNLPVVNHINEIKGDNNYKNLEWCTVAYNNNYGGRLNSIREKHSVPVLQMDMEGKEVNKFPSIGHAARKFGFCRNKISLTCRNKRNSYNGYKWAFSS
jgi:hypothetical protein